MKRLLLAPLLPLLALFAGWYPLFAAALVGVGLFLLRLVVVAGVRLFSSRRPRWFSWPVSIVAIGCACILVVGSLSFQFENRRVGRMSERLSSLGELESPGKADVERILGKTGWIVPGMFDPHLQEPLGSVAETWVYSLDVFTSPNPFHERYYVSFDRDGRFLGAPRDLD